MIKTLRVFMLSAAMLCGSQLCYAYKVGPAKSLDQIVQESDLIVKATVLTSSTTQEAWFDKVAGFDAYATGMHVVSVIKGNVPAMDIVFQHYGTSKNPPFAAWYAPQFYDFEVGRSYIVFAKKTDTDGVFRQLWKNHLSKRDQGVVLAADDSPVTAKGVADIVWTELTHLLASPDTKDIVYAIRQLDEMSNKQAWDHLQDFPRDRALKAIAHLLFSKNSEIAVPTIRAIGAWSPYLDDAEAPFWLTTIGGRKIAGLSERDAKVDNEAARQYWRELVALADSDLPTDVRSLAIRALGRASEPKVLEVIPRWIKNSEPLIRQAAAILLSDFPGPETAQFLTDLAKDQSAEVRVGVARAIGFGQFSGLLPQLDQFFHDTNPTVRTAAALSLVSFAADKTEPILKKNLNDSDFKSIFVNILAETNPEPYLDVLCEVIDKQLEPHDFWGGQIPSFTSWHILFDYVQKQNPQVLQSGRLDKCFDVLERAKVHTSSEPRDLYAFYMKNGMMARAQKLREMCKKTVTFDMESYFNGVDRALDARAPK